MEWPRADAHAHLFESGYVDLLPEACRRRVPDERTLYGALAQRHRIQTVLAVGYEGSSWAAGNNRYLAKLAGEHDWIKPTAFVSHPEALSIEQLEQWRKQGFVGISLYLLSSEAIGKLAVTPEAVWQWLARRGWLLSVNGSSAAWPAWEAILEANTDLRVLISHLGLPEAVTEPPAENTAASTLQPLTRLARYPGVHVKLSGFYAISRPGHEYPHRAAWPYVNVLIESFGTQRLLWGSDFSPALEHVSFPQTFELFRHMPLLTEDDRRKIEGDNLQHLLGAPQTGPVIMGP